MITEPQECPNCGSKLKGGILSSVTLASRNLTSIINEYNDKKVDGYCSKCVGDLKTKYLLKLSNEKEELQLKIQKLIDSIPVVSTHSPLNWDYEIINMVTGQTTTGTGVISEFTSSFTDLFGAQSGRYNN